MEQCKTCAWWNVKDGMPENHGQCRACPPIVLMNAMAVDSKGQPITSPLQGKPVGMIQMPAMYWPVTMADEGCGVHRAKQLQ